MTPNWPRIPLGELTEKRPICYGVLKPGERQSSGVPLIRITDITNNSLDESDLYHITSELSREFRRSILQGEEVLLSIQGTIGRVAICPPHLKGANISRTIALIAPDSRLDRGFLRYWLLSLNGEFPTGGSTRESLNISTLRELSAPVPSIDEQRRIATVLDEAFEAVSTAEKNTRQCLANAPAVFDSRLHSVFEYCRRTWGPKTLDQLATNLDSRRVPITKSERTSGPYPYFGASGVVDHVSDYIFDEECLLVSEDGANLLARSSPIAFPASGRYWVNNHAHVLKFDHRATQLFVQYYLNSIPLDDFVTGAAQPKLTQRALNAIPIPVPTKISEQIDLVQKFENLGRDTMRLGAAYKEKLGLLTELKRSLLHNAFTGRL